MKIVRIGNHDLEIPKQQTESAAGFDLASAVHVYIEPGEQVLIPTGFAWEIYEGFVGLIRDRSGQAYKQRLTTRAGVIDSDYRGEVGVLAVNESNEPISIEPGERIAQMIVSSYLKCSLVEVDEFSDTERGDNGFGSTGCK